jgi:replicative DNA helicase
MMTHRATPHSIEAEKSVLGSILLDNGCLKDVSGQLDGLDFYSEPHREIYRTMLALQLQHKSIDLVTMIQGLKDAGKLAAVGGAEYLAELLDFTPTSANVKHYCRIVREKSAARQLMDFGGKLVASVANGGELGQTLTEAKERLAEIIGGMDGLNGVSAADIISFSKRQERYGEYVKSIKSARFKTYFSLLDRQIRGVAPGELLIIIAYAASFKTAFLQNLLLRGSEETGLFHLFFSLEMPVEKVFEREMQIQGGVSGWDVERHFSGDRESLGVVAGLHRTGSHGLLVCDRPRLTLEKIGRYVEIARQKYGKIGAIGIDYLGLVQAPGKTLFEKTAYVSIEAKNLAKELNVPVIMLCQINRAAATGGEIETHSAKGGGDIEAAADFMLGFQIEKEDKLTCKILKNRNGPAGSKFLVELDRTALQFKDMMPYEVEAKKKKKDIPF